MKTKQTIAQQLNVTKFPFVIKDKNDNKIYWEFSDGFWEKTTFNKHGIEIYWENSNGFWQKYEFDENGNKTYMENSDGGWVKFT